MKQNKDLQIAGVAVIILLLIGIACYGNFVPDDEKKTSEPLRIMYKATAGKVFFDHKAHVQKHGGYAIECMDCHHHIEDDVSSCTRCHSKETKGGALPDSCLECHDSADIEDTSIKNHVDTLHEQCIECHKESGIGPVECSECHVM